MTPRAGSRSLIAVLGLLRGLLRQPQSALGALLVMFFLLLAIFGAQLAPYTNPNDQSHAARVSPTLDIGALRLGEHPFGTDRLGRDVYSRVILGAGSIFRIAGLGTLISVLVGSALGLYMGYRGGWFDELLGRVIDALLAIPALLLALVLVGIIRNLDFEIGSWQSDLADNVVLLVIAVLYVPVVARVARSSAPRYQDARIRRSGGNPRRANLLHHLSRDLAVGDPGTGGRGVVALFLCDLFGGVVGLSRLWRAAALARLGTDGERKPWRILSIDALGAGFPRPGDRDSGHSGQLDVGRRPPCCAEGGLMTPPLLDVENLTISYRIGKRWIPAVRDFHLQLAPGHIVGLVGESGSGKSTVALALMHYLSSNGRVESGGRLAFAGEDLLRKSDAEMRSIWARRIKLVPQNAGAALNPSMKIGAQVTEVLGTSMDLGGAEAEHAMLRMFHDVNLVDPEKVADRYPHELSGGMQQRVVIAMAMITNPELLILDEPTTGLDVTTEAVILDLVRGLMAERDTAVIYITHNLGVVAQLCERVLVLYAGEIMEEAEVHALFQQPRHPYTRGLISSVPKPGQSKHQARLQSISGNPPALRQQTSACVFADRCSLVIERCRSEKPPLESLTDGRVVRCHRWEEVDQPHPPTPSPTLQGGETWALRRAILLPAPMRWRGAGGGVIHPPSCASAT